MSLSVPLHTLIDLLQYAGADSGCSRARGQEKKEGHHLYTGGHQHAESGHLFIV